MIKDAGKNFLFDPMQDKFTDEVFNIAMGDEEESELLGFLGDEGFLEDGDLDFEGLAEGAQEGLADGLEGLGFEEAAAGLEEFDIGETMEGLAEGFDEGFEGIGEGIEECCTCCLECLGGME